MKPLAYHITWTTYGTWLSGDDRGWVARGVAGIQAPDPDRADDSRARMAGEPVRLTDEQRQIVDATIREHCAIRGWTLYAVNVRTNHVHVVVTADRRPEDVMNQFKMWCSRRLNAASKVRPLKWWTYHGSTKWINDKEYLRNAIHYVSELQ
jgi:REP element-mobilizing transposase RayT